MLNYSLHFNPWEVKSVRANDFPNDDQMGYTVEINLKDEPRLSMFFKTRKGCLEVGQAFATALNIPLTIEMEPEEKV